MKILVTGANGYIGSKIVDKLLELHIDVIANDIANDHINPKAHFIKADIFSENDNWFKFFEEPDICIHLAWRDGFKHNSIKHLQDFSLHISFLANLIDNGLPKLVSMGTMHEVGYHEGIINDETACNPLTFYGIVKNALRKSLELYTSQHNCKFQWLRAFYIYGDDDFGNSIFCKIKQAAREKKTNFPFTSGKNKYDFIKIDDLVNQITLAVLQDNILGIINVCSGKPVALAEMVESYIKTNKLNIKLDYGKYPDRIYDSPCIYGDNSKIKEIERKHEKI